VDSKKWFILILALAIVCGIFSILYAYGTAFEKDITIQDKYIKRYDDADRFFVVDSDNNVYMIKDSTLRMQFRSAGLYAKSKIGKSYHIHSFGWRFGLTSTFPVIYAIAEINQLSVTTPETGKDHFSNSGGKMPQ